SDPLAGRDDSSMPDDGDKIPVASRLDPNDAKSVVGILVSHALNQPGQHLPIGLLRLHLHGLHRSGFVAKSLEPDTDVRRGGAGQCSGWAPPRCDRYGSGDGLRALPRVPSLMVSEALTRLSW